MTMINVQATAAGMQMAAADPASAAQAIQAIRRASKSGLRELRAILEVLRHTDVSNAAVPDPDLRAIAALVKAISAAGTPVTLESPRPPVPPPPPVALPCAVQLAASKTNIYAE
jgi:hypothetical protein